MAWRSARIDLPQRLQTRGVLVHANPTPDARLAHVALARVDLHSHRRSLSDRIALVPA